MANGLYSNEELIDTLIVDCNDAVKAVASGQMIQWCKMMYEMVVKLANLKNGVRKDLENREETIEQLRQEIKNLGGNVEKLSMEELQNEVSTDDNPCGRYKIEW